MNGSRITVGVIGCGYWAQRHLAAWRDLADEGADLVAVCDVDESKARTAAARFGVRPFTDATVMLDAMPLGLVDIATRMDTHRHLAEATIARGLATIVQKPLAPTWADALAIADAARAKPTWLAVHENFRFQPAMLKTAAIVAGGIIGPPSWARISFRTGIDVYANQPYFRDEERLVILDLGIHMLDLARVLLGEVEHVSCETQRRNGTVRAEDTATMLLRHRSGAVAVVESTYESRLPPEGSPEVHVTVEGPLGAVVAPVGGREVIVTVRGQTCRERVAADDEDVFQTSVRATCAHCLAALQARREPDLSGADNLNTYALAEAAYAAAAAGRAVAPIL